MELLSEIWQTARRNKLRTSLTGFAVAWGIFMLLVLLGAGNGLLNAQVKQNTRFLSNSMKVFGGFTEKAYHGLSEGRSITLDSKDLRATQTEFTDHIDEVGAEVQAPQSVQSFRLMCGSVISSSVAGFVDFLPGSSAPVGHLSMQRPHFSMPRQRIAIQSTCGSNRWDSGLWHHGQRSGHPFRNTVVRMPGPSWTEKP